MFYVTGLPRSGTAWFANLLTVHNHYCFHEPSIDFDGFEREVFIKRRLYEGVGISDSSLCTYYEDIVRPGEPMLIIIREPSEVRDSLNRLFDFDCTDAVERMVEMVQSIEHDNIRLFKYENLSNLDEVEEACGFLLKGYPVDEDRIRFLMSCNVQRDQDYIASLRKLLGR